MACNCGKNRRSPAGMRKKDDAATAQNSKTASYSLTTTSGKTMTFGSRLEAEATRIREGGGTIRTI